MQLDVRKYLKRVRSMSVEDLEREFNDAIEVARHYPEGKYSKSPILSWIAIAKNAEAAAELRGEETRGEPKVPRTH